ncbi:MAG: amidohydrolase family protein, partial [Longimicrobiales bacterium]|nr:amidohydrolase family protein [Longimicrobiales bacterium]
MDASPIARLALPDRFPFLALFLLALCLPAFSLTALPAGLAAQDLVFTNANVVDVAAGTVTMDATVTIADGLIQTVDASGAAPAGGVRVVDLGGRYLAPGLMDAHVHIGSDADARRALLTGVTTMRSMGASHYADVGMRELQRDGHATTPEYLAAGYHVRPQMAEGFFQDHPELGGLDGGGVTGVDAVRAVTRALLSRDVDFIKTNATERAGLPNTDPRKQLYGEAEIAVMVEEAQRAGILGVAAHAHGDEGGRAAVAAGVRSIEHGTYLSETTLSMMADRGTFLVPTIAIVRDLTIPGGDYDNAVLNIRGRHMLPRVQQMAANAHRLGVKIVAATDTGYGPNSTTTLAHELLELVTVGLTPTEAMRTATINAAELFGIQDRVGRVEPGLEADLIVVEHNPLMQIGTVQDVLMVVSDGEVIVQRGDWAGRPVS